ncbi:MAG: hypothetical protein E7157_05220 [Lactobacillales bacterium]|nr:hypothetical protein [Lactobacillales bacterium]
MENYRQMLEELSKDYEIIKNTDSLDNNNKEKFLINAINFYSKYIKKKEYSEIIDSYKTLYIYNESKVEEDITPEEQLGISAMYDYINNFDFEKDNFNIFITSMLLHQKLYSKCVGSSFGGNLRETSAVLFDTNIEVPESRQAIEEFNKYIATSNDIMKDLENSDLNSYIEKSVKLITDLIKLQPFADGNKRTFRALFNLLLKKINLPPVYIDNSRKHEYKDALIKGMKYKDYTDLINFYYDCIYDAIIKLDINANNLEKKGDLKLK